ncbi:DeoR family transcriptional regulator [Tetragenococcus halophilus subsp. flandriensis]|uniref:DeoR/GlpR family DNA-binding transcription regulator n=1 Tax=Tetragenococcus halophilus TaxID=51669 RepID=UPI0023E95994|nr:DeoR/GlpR family DNA-binding transcription regulator [Tetragenococcus halophilus]GMA08043.1 DeoR family transcriptional regulator [Tetragenococcus halophilus subsp. flandriensis]
MLATEREQFIRSEVTDKGVVYVNQLVKDLKVTPPTIRSDLDKLTKKYNDLDRIHGGIIYKEDSLSSPLPDVVIDYNQRAFTNQQEKKLIAKKAMELLKKGDTILLDSSSTCFEFANVLFEFPNQLTVITNGLSTGALLKQNENLNVLFIGGLLKKDSNTVYDEFNHSILNNFNIDKYFFSATGLSIDSGFSETNLMEVKNKRENVLNSKQTIALIDHTKFNQDSAYTFCTLDEVDYLITDDTLSESIKQFYKDRIQLI